MKRSRERERSLMDDTRFISILLLDTQERENSYRRSLSLSLICSVV